MRSRRGHLPNFSLLSPHFASLIPPHRKRPNPAKNAPCEKCSVFRPRPKNAVLFGHARTRKTLKNSDFEGQIEGADFKTHFSQCAFFGRSGLRESSRPFLFDTTKCLFKLTVCNEMIAYLIPKHFRRRASVTLILTVINAK